MIAARPLLPLMPTSLSRIEGGVQNPGADSPLVNLALMRHLRRRNRTSAIKGVLRSEMRTGWRIGDRKRKMLVKLEGKNP